MHLQPQRWDSTGLAGFVHETVSRISGKYGYRVERWTNCVRRGYAGEGTTCRAGCRSGLDRLFVGLNTGGSVGTGSASQNAAFSSTLLGANKLCSNGSDRYSPVGWVIGGQLGYNKQISN